VSGDGRHRVADWHVVREFEKLLAEAPFRLHGH